MTAGMAFEAMNQAGHLGTRMIVVLNDNSMSISPSVGALTKYLEALMAGPPLREAQGRHQAGAAQDSRHRRPDGRGGQGTRGGPAADLHARYALRGARLPLRRSGERALDAGPARSARERRRGSTARCWCTPSPRRARATSTPRTSRSSTTDRRRSIRWPGSRSGKPASAPSYTAVFGKTIVRLAEHDPRIVAITASMPDGTGLIPFAERFPERFLNTGIAEQHSVTLAAGLALGGSRPVVAIYSTFLQRGFDQIFHDVCLMDAAGRLRARSRRHRRQRRLDAPRPVRLRLFPDLPEHDRHGAEGRERAAAHARDGGRAVAPDGGALSARQRHRRAARRRVPPAADRQGGGAAPRAPRSRSGRSARRSTRRSKRSSAWRKEGIELTLVNARFVKPLDRELLRAADRTARPPKAARISRRSRSMSLAGGFGSAPSSEALSEMELASVDDLPIGVPDKFVPHGSQEVLRKTLGLDADGLSSASGASSPDRRRSRRRREGRIAGSARSAARRLTRCRRCVSTNYWLSAGFSPAREKARRAVMAGLVDVNGVRVDKPGTPMRTTSDARRSRGRRSRTCRAPAASSPRRSTHFALIPPVGAASTSGLRPGGFTDCLLQRGAAQRRPRSTSVYGLLDLGFAATRGSTCASGSTRATSRRTPSPRHSISSSSTFPSSRWLKVVPALLPHLASGGRLLAASDQAAVRDRPRGRRKGRHRARRGGSGGRSIDLRAGELAALGLDLFGT